MGKKFLVTGGCGFIGSHVATALVARGNRVVILDDLSTGKRDHLAKLATFVKGDICDYSLISNLMQEVDGVFHLAAIASVVRSVEEWVATHHVNASATVNIFDCAAKQGRVVPVVYTSSAAVYGDNTHIPLKESEIPKPLTAYGVDKLSCELHAQVAWFVKKVPNAGIRPFNVYGPQQDPNSPYSGVISIFVHKIMQGEPITIYGDGEQTRDFIYVSDMVSLYLAAMDNLKEGASIVNGCTGKQTTVNMLADSIEKICNKKVRREYMSPRQGDIRISEGDATRMKKMYGLTAKVTLEEGLKKTIASMG